MNQNNDDVDISFVASGPSLRNINDLDDNIGDAGVDGSNNYVFGGEVGAGEKVDDEDEKDNEDGEDDSDLSNSHAWDCLYCSHNNRKPSYKFECERCHKDRPSTQDADEDWLSPKDILASAPFLVESAAGPSQADSSFNSNFVSNHKSNSAACTDYKPTTGPMCNCIMSKTLLPIKVRKNNKNKGRRFFSCDSCDFWMWEEDYGQEELKRIEEEDGKEAAVRAVNEYKEGRRGEDSRFSELKPPPRPTDPTGIAVKNIKNKNIDANQVSK